MKQGTLFIEPLRGKKKKELELENNEGEIRLLLILVKKNFWWSILKTRKCLKIVRCLFLRIGWTSRNASSSVVWEECRGKKKEVIAGPIFFFFLFKLILQVLYHKKDITLLFANSKSKMVMSSSVRMHFLMPGAHINYAILHSYLISLSLRA